MVRKLLTNAWFQRIFDGLIIAFGVAIFITGAAFVPAKAWFGINVGFRLFATVFLVLLIFFLANIVLYAGNTKMWDTIHNHRHNNTCFMLLPDIKKIVNLTQRAVDFTNEDT